MKSQIRKIGPKAQIFIMKFVEQTSFQAMTSVLIQEAQNIVTMSKCVCMQGRNVVECPEATTDPKSEHETRIITLPALNQ